MRKKNNSSNIYIDSENISAKKYKDIEQIIRHIGVANGIRVYGIQKDAHTKAWSEKCHADERLKDIRLFGRP